MICGLIGSVFRLEAMRVELNVQGVVYEVAISVQTSAKIRTMLESGGASVAIQNAGIIALTDKENIAIYLLITHLIREDSQLLFGFLDHLERATFERLLKINGVGPKVALAILSTFSAQNFAQIVRNKDMQLLQKVPGVGAKSAGKILLDLAGFCKEILESSFDETTNQAPSSDSAKNEASSALEALGYKSAEIKKVLARIQGEDTQTLIKEALKFLSQGVIR